MKNINLKAIMPTLFAIFFAVYPPMRLFMFIPLIFLYYAYGIKTFINVSKFFLVSVIFWQVVNFFSTKNSIPAISDVTTQNSNIIDSSNITDIFSQITTRLFIFDLLYIVGGIFAVYVLLHTHLNWILRISVASVVIFFSVFLQAYTIQAVLPELLQASEFKQLIYQLTPIFKDTANGMSPNEMIIHTFSIALFFSWIFTIVNLLFNWLVAIVLLQRKLHFTINDYLCHIYKRIVLAKSSYLGSWLIISSVITAVLFLFDSNFATLLQYIGGNFVVICLFYYFLVGFTMGYFYISSKIKAAVEVRLHKLYGDSSPAIHELRSDFYLLFFVLILLIPFVNVVIVSTCLLSGIKKSISDMKHIKNKT